MAIRRLVLIVLLSCLISCGRNSAVPSEHLSLPDLPVAVANNAVSSVTVGTTDYLVSFAGIGGGLSYRDTHAKTFVFSSASNTWSERAPVPGDVGRLAATAETVGNLVYVFGGYTVAEDETEVSTPWVHSFDPVTGKFVELSPMPIPVDDAVSVVYQDRYVYLISGWHDYGNANLVQRFDIQTNRWTQATPIPGTPVFGHAGGIVGSTIVYCDGVAVFTHPDRARTFGASNECWMGTIDAEDSRRIDWRPIEPHPGLSRYRMAASGVADRNAVLFVGGGDNPYNYDGVGYDGQPTSPVEGGMLLDLESKSWREVRIDSAPSMDHRGLVRFRNGWVTIGGIGSTQNVLASVNWYALR